MQVESTTHQTETEIFYKSPEKICSEVNHIIKQAANPLFVFIGFKNDKKERSLTWRAARKSSDTYKFPCKKGDTIFHIAMRYLSEKEFSYATKILTPLIKLAFQHFKEGGDDCLLSKEEENDNYFWEMRKSDDESERLKKIMQEHLDLNLNQTEVSPIQAPSYHSSEKMYEQMEHLSRSEDILNYQLQNHSREKFCEWKDEYLTLRANSSYINNHLFCEKGDTLLQMAIRQLMCEEDRVSARRYVGLIFFLIQRACEINKSCDHEFLLNKNFINDTFLSLLKKMIEASSIEINPSLPKMYQLVQALCKGTYLNLLLSNGTQINENHLQYRLEKQDVMGMPHAIVDDTLAHFIMREMLYADHLPANHFVLLVLLFLYSYGRYQDVGKTFLNAKNSMGNTFLEELANTLRMNQNPPLVIIEAEEEEKAVDELVIQEIPESDSVQVEEKDSVCDLMEIDDENDSLPIEVEANKICKVIDEWSSNLFSLLFLSQPIDVDILKYQVKEDVGDYKKGDSVFNILIKRFLQNRRSLKNIALLLFYIKFAGQNYRKNEPHGIPCTLNEFQKLDISSKHHLENALLKNLIYRSLPVPFCKQIPSPVQRFNELVKKLNQTDVNAVDMCNSIEFLDQVFLVEDDELGYSVINKLLKWHSDKEICSAGKPIQRRCDKGETLLHAAIHKLLIANVKTSPLSCWGAVIGLIHLAMKYPGKEAAKFLKARSHDGLACWELLCEEDENLQVLKSWVNEAVEEIKLNSQKEKEPLKKKRKRVNH